MKILRKICARQHLFSTVFVCLLTVLLVSFSLSSFSVSNAEAAEDSWATMTPMPTARAGLGVAVVKGKIYVIGGINDSITCINEEYDPATDTWTTKEPMPTPRTSFGIVVHQNKIYVIGGDSTNGVTGANEVYDPATDTWENKTPMSTNRDLLDANVVNDKIYLIGGLAKGLGPWYPNVSGSTEVYDPATDSWTTKTSIPTPVFSYASAVVDNKIYVIGGSTATVALANLNQIYDPETDTWASGNPPSKRVTEAEAGATTGLMAPKRIYVIGGRSIDDQAQNTIQVYNPENDSWTVGASMLTARFHLAIAVANDKLYAIGGYPFYKSIPPQIKCEENEQYTPVGYIPEFPTWTPMLLMLIVLTVMAIIYKRRLLKTPIR